MRSTVIRYINNTDTDVVVGVNLVPKFDQVISHDFIPELDALAGKTLQVLVDGVELTADLVPANIAAQLVEEAAAAKAEVKLP